MAHVLPHCFHTCEEAIAHDLGARVQSDELQECASVYTAQPLLQCLLYTMACASYNKQQIQHTPSQGIGMQIQHYVFVHLNNSIVLRINSGGAATFCSKKVKVDLLCFQGAIAYRPIQYNWKDVISLSV